MPPLSLQVQLIYTEDMLEGKKYILLIVAAIILIIATVVIASSFGVILKVTDKYSLINEVGQQIDCDLFIYFNEIEGCEEIIIDFKGKVPGEVLENRLIIVPNKNLVGITGNRKQKIINEYYFFKNDNLKFTPVNNGFEAHDLQTLSNSEYFEFSTFQYFSTDFTKLGKRLRIEKNRQFK